MRDLAAVVERMHMVRAARGRFLRLWKLSRRRRLPAYPGASSALDRLAADVARAGSVTTLPGRIVARVEPAAWPGTGGRIARFFPGGRTGDEPA